MKSESRDCVCNMSAINDETSITSSILQSITSPTDLKSLSIEQLGELAREIRSVICKLSELRSIHLASNLGVVELTIALHYVFDFSWDRLVFDVGHQCYPHKLLTGRFDRFDSLRTWGGLSGYPNPQESDYDLFMTGHAGCSVGTALGLSLGDRLVAIDGDKRNEAPEQPSVSHSGASCAIRNAVAVVGDGSFTSGPIFEAMNHAGDIRQKLLVVLNDNKMSICRRVGGFGRYLDHLRMAPGYVGAKSRIRTVVEKLPSVHSGLLRFKDALKAGLIGGSFFEALGFQYVGPIDGHDLRSLISYFEAVKAVNGPVLLHVLTEKGRGFRPAEIDPSHFHSSSPAKMRKQRSSMKSAEAKNRRSGAPSQEYEANRAEKKEVEHEESHVNLVASDRPFTYWAQTSIMKALRKDPRVCVVVAAMTQGNMLEEARKEFPDRFFDVGISEAHAVNLAAGLAKSGMHPIVDIYSCFLQRAYDHLFQEASLQSLPIVFSLDRAGFVGSDGPTHHGVFDLSYLRPFPNMTVLAPGDSIDMGLAFDYAIAQKTPVAIRYPKTKAGRLEREAPPFETGKPEVIRPGKDGMLLGCGGGLLDNLLIAAEILASGKHAYELPPLDVCVLNARFIKPLEPDVALEYLQASKPVVSVEENVLSGGYGSALLEVANDRGFNTKTLVRLGAPDCYIPHGSRDEELEVAGMDLKGILSAFSRAFSRSNK
ncbi:MAG: 1-deoxy-D-xylulose-5-phosphate synthase [Thermoguttaceae bacterium]|nr:1-deoxy-D-xylulose-5-phosphate synthase [Thermoguttaceae bacterium]